MNKIWTCHECGAKLNDDQDVIAELAWNDLVAVEQRYAELRARELAPALPEDGKDG